MRIQSPIKNRKRLYAGVDPRIEKGLERLGRRFNCSKSYVANTLLGDAMGIELQEHFYDTNSTEATGKIEAPKGAARLLHIDAGARAKQRSQAH